MLLVGEIEVERVTIDGGVLPLRGDAGDSDGVGAGLKDGAGNGEGHSLIRIGGGAGDDACEAELALGVVEIDCIGGEAGLLVEIDGEGKSLLAIGSDGETHASSCAVQGRGEKEMRLVSGLAERRVCDEVLIADDEQEGGKDGRGNGRTPPGEPSIALFLGLGGGHALRLRSGEFGELGAGFIDECGRGAEVEGAVRTIEEVLFESVTGVGRKLVEQVFFRGHLINCFAMIHQNVPNAVQTLT